MRNRFDKQLDELNEALAKMGAYCENAIASAAKALTGGDHELARKVIEADAEIDRMEREIEELCVRMLLKQQPVAGDLRFISSAMKMITDMERIADQAADIAEIVTMTEIKPIDAESLAQMAREAIKMVTDSMESFVKSDLPLAKAVIMYDDVVDGLFGQVKSELIEIIKDGRENAGYALDMLMIAKYFERIGDHATNIDEWVEYSITGVHSGT